MTLEGYLGADAYAQTEEKIEHLKDQKDKTLLIELSSSSGDLDGTFRFVQQIYELKVSKGLNVIVYIRDRAVGPAAMIPFLADELMTSPMVAWGDIPYGVEKNINLRSRTK